MRFGIKILAATAIAVTITLAYNGCSSSVRYTRESFSGQQQSASCSKSVAKKGSPKTVSPIFYSASSQSKLAQVSESYLGTPYKYGGTSRDGIDCSAFAGAVYREVYGVNLPRTSVKMWKKGKAVRLDAAKPGDLCFFRLGGKRGGIDHVGIYMGNNRFIHASTSSGVIYGELTDTYFSSRFAGIRRMH